MQILVLLVLLLAVRPVRRLERRLPYVFPLALFAGALVLREQWVAIGGYHNLRFQLHGVVWFFVLGWLVQRSTTPIRKVVTTTLCVLTLPGFFLNEQRGWFIAGGLVLLVWCRELPFPRALIRPVAAIAAASMVIFVSHFRLFPVLDRNLDKEVAYVATIAAGVGIWVAGEVASRQARRLLADVRSRRLEGSPRCRPGSPSPWTDPGLVAAAVVRPRGPAGPERGARRAGPRPRRPGRLPGRSRAWRRSARCRRACGLAVVSFQRRLQQFLEVQARLAGEPLEEHIEPQGGDFYLALPGVTEDPEDHLVE